MSSYLNIYLERKKKDGERDGERLLLYSISRANPIYSLFYDNSIGICREDNLHEFKTSDLYGVLEEMEHKIPKELIDNAELKQYLQLISNKDAIVEMLDQIKANKDYINELMEERVNLCTLYAVFNDVGEEWCSFEKLYWKID